VEELATAAGVAGATRARNPATAVRATLSQSETAIALPDGRWSSAASLLDGVVLTHRVRSSTAGRRDLWPRNDLFPLMPLLSRGMPLAGGGAVVLAEGHRNPFPVLLGPADWLPVVPAGTLLALRWRARVLTVAPTDVDPDAVTDEVATLRDAFAYHRDANSLRRWQPPFAAAVLGALLEIPGLLSTALPPLGEILGDLLRLPDPPRPVRSWCCCTSRHEPPYGDYPEADAVSPTFQVDDDEVVRPLFP